MEFNGFLGSDFDFFKRKDKLERDDYERGRNEVKVHFRGLCYEIQRMYHKNTGGVLELQRDFQNFNRRSSSISAEHSRNKYRILISLNSEALDIELIDGVKSREECEALVSSMKKKKKVLWEYLMSGKNMHLYLTEHLKSKNNRVFSYNSMDINSKKYDDIVSFLEKGIEENRTHFTFGIGCSYNRKECLRQGKGLLNSVYDSTIRILELSDKLE